jgi:peptidyl-prolyl cis-trans isomerase D
MALIGKIRDKSWLIILFLGLALVVFAFFSDPQSPAVQWLRSLFYSETKTDYGFGTVYGEKVDMAKFEEANLKFQQIDQMEMQRTGKVYTPADLEASSDKAWNYTVENTILAKEFEALGIVVDEEEFEAYLYGDEASGFSPLPQLAQSFSDSTGKFNADLLRKRITELEESQEAKDQAEWKDYKKSLTEDRQKEKYYNILALGIYVTKLEAEDEYFGQKEIKNISYVAKLFDQIPDAEINISDKDVRAYYDAHKMDKKYAVRESSRALKYFEIPIRPSQTDLTNFDESLKTLKKDLEKSPNDTSLAYVYMDQLPNELKNNLSNLKKDSVYGPFTSNAKQLLYKLHDIKEDPKDSNYVAKASHILIQYKTPSQADKNEAKKRAEEVLAQLKGGANFESTAMNNSSDQGSATQGGDLGWFGKGRMVKPFEDAVFSANQVGLIPKLIESQFGYHIIKVTEPKTNRKFRISSADKEITPSDDTKDDIENKALELNYTFEEKINAVSGLKVKLNLFDTLAKKAGYDVRMLEIKEKSPKVNGIISSTAQKAMLRLAYGEEAALGAITSAPVKNESSYVIAIVSSIKTEGIIPSFEDVELEMKNSLIKEKKAEKIKNLLAKYSDLNGMAQGLGLELKQSEVTFASGQIIGVGPEPLIVGAIFSGLKDGQRTKPLVGDYGIYVIRIDKTVTAPATKNYENERKQLLAPLKGNVRNEALSALIDKAEVRDNRRFYAAGIRQ